MKMEILVDREDLQKVLLLIIHNDNLSASRAGLEQRAKNRKEMKKELLFMLELTNEEAESLYLRELGNG